MQVILGIGNPGSRYSLNRHNVGFLLLDNLADYFKIKFKPADGNYFSASGTVNDTSFNLIKPSGYVNNSGIAAKELIERFEIDSENMLVVCDDVNLDFGRLRIRKSGGDGGHNGLRSIIYHLNSNKFPRLRIGVGNPEQNINLVDFVLSDFNKDELSSLNEVFSKATTLIVEFIKGGITGILEANSKLGKTIKPDEKA